MLLYIFRAIKSFCTRLLSGKKNIVVGAAALKHRLHFNGLRYVNQEFRVAPQITPLVPSQIQGRVTEKEGGKQTDD